MASAPHVVIAGAGIGGLTTALTLARAGFRVSVLEQAEKLEPIGAGIQLSPNATRVLIALGLGDRLAPSIVAPRSIRVLTAASAREIVRIPLLSGEARYGAPFWVLHRGDLQSALADAVTARPEITLKLGTKVESFSTENEHVRVFDKDNRELIGEHASVLIGADGIWSSIGKHLAQDAPQFSRRVAWRALVPAENVSEEFRATVIHLWLGSNAHLVHYPVKGGRLINIVAIVHDTWRETGWSAAGERAEIMRHFSGRLWAAKVQGLIATPEQWAKWALYERHTPFRGGTGPVTLLGDAAHPVLPFLALGAGMAIEDAAIITDCLNRDRNDPVRALRTYEDIRRPRTARTQRASARQGRIYGMSGPQALVRNLAMRTIGGENLLKRFDWLYSGQLPPSLVGTIDPKSGAGSS